MNKIRSLVKTTIKKAGKRLLREYKEFNRSDIKLKARHEIVTKADLISEKIIISSIKKNFPEHQILSEESGKTKGGDEFLWIVDPLDGTTNFSIHNPLWSVSIGLAYKNKLIIGAVYSPLQDELFFAERAKGAFLNDKKIHISKMEAGKTINAFCHGSSESNIKKALKYYNYLKINGFDCRQLGSAAIELAYVACGRIESIMIPGANAWDVAAGELLVEEAGGKVTDFTGKKWNLKSRDILASNNKNHNKLLKIINR